MAHIDSRQYYLQAQLAFSQPTEQTGTVRVTVTMNADGSRTVYKFDDAQHKAVRNHGRSRMGRCGKNSLSTR